MSDNDQSIKQIDSYNVANAPYDLARRRAIVRATTALGAIGVAVASLPFIESMLPSEAAKAGGAPIEVDITNIEPDTLLMVEWRGKPVWILHRSQKMMQLLGKNHERLSDPDSEVPQQPLSCKNATRSIKPEYLVAVGICTHLGCVPTFRPDVAPIDLGSEWYGGFYCPCHGSKYDLAGRVYKGVPAPTNLVIPPHNYSSDSHLVIGINLA